MPLSVRLPSRPETLSDLRFSLSALSQEIATLRLVLEKGWPSPRRNTVGTELGRRLDALSVCRESLERELAEKEQRTAAKPLHS